MPCCCSMAARSRASSLQARSAQLRRVRREARLRAGPDAGPVQRARRAHRRADLRGHLDAGCRANAWPRPAAEILLVPNGSPFEAGKEDVRLQSGRRARERKRPAADLSQPGRRPGRAGVRRRLVGAQCRRARSRWRCRPGKRRSSSPNGRATASGWVCAPGERAPEEDRTQSRLSRHDAGPARLCEQEPLSRRGAGAFRRHRFRAVAPRSRWMRWAPTACAA